MLLLLMYRQMGSADRQIQRQKETETERDRQKETETERDRDRKRQRQAETETDRGQTEKGRRRDRDSQRDRDRPTDRQTETDRDRQRQTETFRNLRPGVEMVQNLEEDPQEQIRPQQQRPLGVRCMVSRYAQLNGVLGEFRARASEAGWHLWLLGQDTEIVEPVGFRREGIPIVTPQKPPPGYFISCWVCGLSYATARWKAVRQSTCGHAALACGKHMSQIARVTLNERVLPSFQAWLGRINVAPERRALHWPQIVQDGQGGFLLRCQKCRAETSHHKKHVFLKARCGKSQLHAVLCPEVPAVGDQEQHSRGGLRMNLATLNVATLVDKELFLSGLGVHVLGVQETVVPRNKRSSVASSLRQLGGNVVFSDIHPGDERKRGERTTVRLGSGLACIGFSPWKVSPLGACIPRTPALERCYHRVLSCIASCGSTHLMVHVVYACPYHTHGMLADICDTVAMTVQMYPHAHHAIMGDWQCNIVMEEFGLLLKGMGWIAHSDFLGQRPSNRPFRGESRRLDEMFLCPSLAGNIQEAHQEAIAGASAHDLMNVVLGFDLDPIRGVQIQRGLN